jgi:hypothetical protein
VEGVIRDDFTIEGYEVIELLCDLIAERAVRNVLEEAYNEKL